MSTYDIVLEEMYAGKRRIEALEKQMAEMTVRAEKAEARAAALREALWSFHSSQHEIYPVILHKPTLILIGEMNREKFKQAERALVDTAEAAEAYEKRVRAKVLEEVREILSQLGPFTLRDAFEERLAALEAEAPESDCENERGDNDEN